MDSERTSTGLSQLGEAYWERQLMCDDGAGQLQNTRLTIYYYYD